ncbi:MAG: hypothetical protein JXA52_05615 [Planctomycetes bacterium]|nr:hypothetical protein [Planctomycetota bacterium]
MADQGDLQKWLEELKKRAGAPQGGSGAQRRYQPAPPPVAQPASARPDAPRPMSMTEYLAHSDTEERAEEVDFTRSVNREAQRRRQQEARQHKLEQEHRRVEREAAKLEQQRRQELKAEQDARKIKDVYRAKLKVEAASHGKQAKKASQPSKGIQLKQLHRHLRGNRAILREAVILSEILGQPKALRKTEGLWEG